MDAASQETNYVAKEKEYVREMLQPLLGATIVQVDAVVDDDGTYGRFPPVFPVLVVKLKNGEKRICFVEEDEEGNGAGFLRIMQ